MLMVVVTTVNVFITVLTRQSDGLVGSCKTAHVNDVEYQI
jgi:hypothetical protein